MTDQVQRLLAHSNWIIESLRCFNIWVCPGLNPIQRANPKRVRNCSRFGLLGIFVTSNKSTRALFVLEWYCMTCRAPESFEPLLAQQNHGMWTMVEVLAASAAGKRHPDGLSWGTRAHHLKVFKVDQGDMTTSGFLHVPPCYRLYFRFHDLQYSLTSSSTAVPPQHQLHKWYHPFLLRILGTHSLGCNYHLIVSAKYPMDMNIFSFMRSILCIYIYIAITYRYYI